MATSEDATPSQKPVSVLFVCLGNICRSTMAEGVFLSLTQTTTPPHPLISRIDSCGTGAYHVGSKPDSRTMSTLVSYGITSYRHSARKFRREDFDEFDFVFAMDDENLEDLEQMRGREVRRRKKGGEGEEGLAKVMLFGEFGRKRKSGKGEEVQDPYYGAKDGFEIAYEQSVRFGKRFLEALEKGELV
ncbi:phosphotyrosine protein phosphatases I [Amniculicola lignicola CBS 123094]|uniref:Phosphotyrosine protein phosphatases I n=1 Tax=Amniculicola lignicola CBS 123094 TaxID=1392246 RepID=A0A6A5X435_9PLEO|nr:phosphotyrosine protein phosphatases I [Amniculicola lignicola CBS 123094]